MIETIMVFALGFLSAGMLTLLFLPVFWRRAMRLSERRLQMQMPLSMTEIVAERDQLRAEFAAERRKLEQNSEKLAAALANGRIELGQRVIRMIALEDRVAAVELDEAGARQLIAQYERQLSELELERAAFDKAHYDTAGMLERRTAELAGLSKDHEVLKELSNERRLIIAGLETRLSGVQMEFQASQENLRDTRKALAEKISQIQYLERERDQFRADAVSARERREAMQGSISSQQQLVEKLDAELRAGRRERARLAGEIANLGQSMEQANAAADRLKSDLRTQGQALEQSKQALAIRTDELKAGQAVLQGALDAARRDNHALRAELSELRRRYPMEIAGAAIQSGKTAGNMTAGILAAGTLPGLVQVSASGRGPHGGGPQGSVSNGPAAQDNSMQTVVARTGTAIGNAAQDDDLADLRKSIADFGADIIRAADAMQQASRAPGGGIGQMPAAAAHELSEKVRELESRLHPAAGGR